MNRPENPYLRYPTPLVIAHRGGGGLWPENTQCAFEHAAQLPGVVALETDMHPTKDGILMVAHDEDLDRMTNGHGRVVDHTLAELRKLDAGYYFSPDGGQTYPWRGRGCYLPTLAELFERFPEHVINIDIKQQTPSIVEPFVALIERYGMTHNVVVGSFHEETLAEFRRCAPQVATAASYNEVRLFYLLNKIGLTRFWRGQCVVFQIPETDENRRVVTPRFVHNLKRCGQQVHVWTVNESADMRRLLEWGVDGIITDYPDRLLALLEGRH
jgi:glycerophosphoryl diester phosphodiesterase